MADSDTVQEELLDLYKEHTGIRRFSPSYTWSSAIAELPGILRSGVNRIPSGSVRLEHEDTSELYSDEGGSVAVIFEIQNHDGTIQYFRNDGYTSSWDGTEWQTELYEVRRKPKNTYDYVRV